MERMNCLFTPKTTIVKQLFLVLVLCLFNACSNKYSEEPPNIIFVLADDLGYGDLSSYNPQGKIKTPHLDRLAMQGMRFTDAHTSSSVCTPTRYGIITGRYNWRSRLKQGVLTGKSKALIEANRTTVASMLKSKGYHTAFMGKWHLGWNWAQLEGVDSNGEGWNAEDFNSIDFSKPIERSPNDLGFDYAYGFSGSLDMAPYVYVENRMPTQIPRKSTESKSKYGWWRKGPTSDDFIHSEVTPHLFEKSEAYIKAQAREDKPFFLYLALPSPHTPILPNEEWNKKSGLNPYADFVMMIDDYMGRLNATIKAAGIEENTLIVFTSDNGCSPAAKIDELVAKGHRPSGEFRGHKADIFEGGHRVPFIVKWPKRIRKGIVSDEVICTTDFMATCADLAGYSLADNEAEDSYSLLPVLTQQQLTSPLREATVHHSINGSFAIRRGDWKLILCPDSGGWSAPKPSDKELLKDLPPIQLYNLEEDPGEQINLQDQHPKKVTELKSLLIKYIEEGRSTPGAPQENDSISFKWKQIEFSL